MKKYALIYSIANLLLLMLLGAAADLFKFKGGAEIAAGSIISASYVAARFFAKDHFRLPTFQERTSFA